MMKLLSSHFAGSVNDTTTAEKPASQEEKRGRGRSKSPHRKTPRKSPNPTKTPVTQGTPANHITTLLLKSIMCSCPENPEQPHLSTLEHVGALSDLVLAIPACGAAVHRFKLVHVDGGRIHNAISGCPDPPQTAVSYFLHNILPQPRLAPKQESKETICDTAKDQKMMVYNRTKMSQAAARLMGESSQ